MYQIELANGTTYELIDAQSSKAYIQGLQRRIIELQISKTYLLENVDNDFTSDNPSRIKITTDSGTFVHEGYGIRAELAIKPYVVTQATSTTPEITEDRIFIVLAELTYEETQIKQMRDTLDTIIIYSLEGGA